jgi:archaeal type IV pilus assembly protein PilA
MNTYLRKIKKNSKALSPVVASIILIAVTVAVSVVVAAWMGGMSLGLMNNAEQVTATNPVFDNTANPPTVTLTLRNTGASSVTISDQGTIDGNTADVAAVSGTLPGTLTIAKGNAAEVSLALPAGFTPGAQYQLNIVTTKGNTIVYTATYNP